MTQAEPDAAAERRLVAWIERNLPAEVISIERQHRWRPSWYVVVRMKDGARRSIYVRGDRTATSVTNRFDTEYEILRILEAEGIMVPHIYGMCPDPKAIVMDQAPGRADLSTADSDAERAAVMIQYMEELARIHAIDPAKFDGIDLPRPNAPADIPLSQFDNYEKLYRSTKRRAEPVLEYLIRWVQRNAPRDRTDVRFLVCDPAQFMFDKGRLTAMLDFEMAYMGESTHDIAALQLRDTSEPLGDLAPALRHYEAITGKPIDPALFDFQAIAWCVVTPVSMTNSVTEGLPTGSVVQYLEWWVTFCRIPLELIAATTNIMLIAPPPIVGEPAPFASMAQSLIGAVKAIPVEDGFASYERDSAANLAAFMARVGEFGPGIVRQDMAETEALLGTKFDSWQAADAALEAFVLSAGPEEDDRLVQLLYSRAHRQCQLFAPFLSRPSVGISLKTFAQLMAT